MKRRKNKYDKIQFHERINSLIKLLAVLAVFVVTLHGLEILQ